MGDKGCCWSSWRFDNVMLLDIYFAEVEVRSKGRIVVVSLSVGLVVRSARFLVGYLILVAEL